jgi:two-component system, chemotaxis family, protein-glutamate methylesterase/glutaminase
VPYRDIVVIGASAGGIEALQRIFGGLPAHLNAAILVVLHSRERADSILPRIFERAGRLPAMHPRSGDTIHKGRIYVAPPDFHMIVDQDHLLTVKGPTENGTRPAIDPLFRSAAVNYGNRVIGVVLTGMLNDGTSGLMVIRANGGEAIVQDPETAMFPSMPQSALERVPDAHVLELDDIAPTLVRLISEEIKSDYPGVRDRSAIQETGMAELRMSDIENEMKLGKPSVFGCPECGGVLWEINQGDLLRFRCRVGHAFTAEHLRAEQRQVVESSLWAALRALEESASLYRRMAQRARESDHKYALKSFEDRAITTEENSRVLRDFLVNINKRTTELEELEKPA